MPDKTDTREPGKRPQDEIKKTPVPADDQPEREDEYLTKFLRNSNSESDEGKEGKNDAKP